VPKLVLAAAAVAVRVVGGTVAAVRWLTGPGSGSLAKAGECPTSRMFRTSREIEDADYRPALVELVRPHVQP
jgi:hypothetical protein